MLFQRYVPSRLSFQQIALLRPCFLPLSLSFHHHQRPEIDLTDMLSLAWQAPWIKSMVQ